MNEPQPGEGGTCTFCGRRFVMGKSKKWEATDNTPPCDKCFIIAEQGRFQFTMAHWPIKNPRKIARMEAQ